MSEPKLISPLLDGFSVGAPISDHDGVCCYPAIKVESEQKYILKTISIPASQTQLDALLLTGAYTEPTDALEYFRELSEGVEREAECLKNLARLEGFIPYEGWQTIPTEGRLGYEVYLLCAYRYCLERHMKRNTMTHLEAVNLGIDICNALCAARRAGWIYADLKPSNIFISETKEYRIGDLGLMELEGLELASLPGKYRSAYSAPELQDEMVSPNTTMDTYALGLILYQIFNNGQLPTVKHPTEDPLPPPENADYELAEILLRACAPDPKDRWEDPASMGQALVAYLQRNTVKDTPVAPPMAQLDSTDSGILRDDPFRDQTLPEASEEPELFREAVTQEVSSMVEQADDLIFHDLPAPPVAPEGATVEELEADLLREAAEKLAQQETEEALPEAENFTPVEAQQEPDKQKEKSDFSDLGHKRRKERRKAILLPVTLFLVFALLGGGALWLYNNYYLQMINSLSVIGTEDEMTVLLDTEIDNALLKVVCTDTYGNTTHSDVTDGKATFSDLKPDMLYKIRVEIEGFHKLDGSTTHEYATPAETRIASYSAVTGTEDGSVILNFTVDGPDSDEWTVICTAEGEQTLMQSFTGHMVTVNGLTVGKTYTIQLAPTTELYIVGEDSLEYTASAIVIAENLEITTTGSGSLTVTWNAPEGIQVSSWNVRCYSVDGYDQTQTTSDLTATFSDLSVGSAYTVEVTAAGMTQSARAGITANPIYIDAVHVDESNVTTLTVSWDYTGNAPEGGWLLLYTIGGNGRTQVVQCESNSGLLEVRVPSTTYDFTIQAADGSTVFQNTYSYKTPNAEVYQNIPQAFYREAHAEYFFVNLLKTPGNANWTHSDVSQNMYTTTFKSGEGISVLMYFMKNFYIRHENIQVMYVIRDENGNVLSDYIAMENRDWRDDMWKGRNYHYCGLDVPLLPTDPGNYSLGIYFNGYAVTSVNFTITE